LDHFTLVYHTELMCLSLNSRINTVILQSSSMATEQQERVMWCSPSWKIWR